MGLDVSIKGLEREDTYHGGYIRFGNYRMQVAKAFNETIGKIYEKPFKIFGYKYSDEEIQIWNSIIKDNFPLDNFLWHSDYDGKFTYKECKKIYDELKKLQIPDLEYSEKYTMHELWLNMFKHCYKNRVNMYFY